MRDETRSLPPMVELVAGRLHGKAQRRPGAEIEHELMSSARSRSDNGPGEAAFDCAMKMAAKNSLDLRMAQYDFGKGSTTIKAVLVHLVDPGHKRRVVHQHQCRLIRRCRQRTGEPMQARLAQGSADFAWDYSVQRDYSQRVVFDHIVQEILTRKVSVRSKRLAH